MSKTYRKIPTASVRKPKVKSMIKGLTTSTDVVPLTNREKKLMSFYSALPYEDKAPTAWLQLPLDLKSNPEDFGFQVCPLVHGWENSTHYLTYQVQWVVWPKGQPHLKEEGFNLKALLDSCSDWELDYVLSKNEELYQRLA